MRRKLIRVLGIFSGVFLFTATLYSQVSVEVIGTSTDMTGQRFIYFLKEGFRQSSAFELNDGYGVRWQLIVLTMPKEESNPNRATIYSIVWNMVLPGACNMDEAIIYFYSTVGYCGRNVVESSAQSIVAQTDQIISEMRKAILNPSP